MMRQYARLKLTSMKRMQASSTNSAVMQPLVLLCDPYSASLDGMTLEADLLLEINCPWRGRESGLWKAVNAGRVPEHQSSAGEALTHGLGRLERAFVGV